MENTVSTTKSDKVGRGVEFENSIFWGWGKVEEVGTGVNEGILFVRLEYGSYPLQYGELFTVDVNDVTNWMTFEN